MKMNVCYLDCRCCWFVSLNLYVLYYLLFDLTFIIVIYLISISIYLFIHSYFFFSVHMLGGGEVQLMDERISPSMKSTVEQK